MIYTFLQEKRHVHHSDLPQHVSRCTARMDIITLNVPITRAIKNGTITTSLSIYIQSCRNSQSWLSLSNKNVHLQSRNIFLHTESLSFYQPCYHYTYLYSVSLQWLQLFKLISEIELFFIPQIIHLLEHVKIVCKPFTSLFLF